MAEPVQSKCKRWFYLLTSGLGLFVGIAGFLTFTFVFYNYQAGFLALFSGESQLSNLNAILP